jgi:hypothetical protein
MRNVGIRHTKEKGSEMLIYIDLTAQFAGNCLTLQDGGKNI